jgi:hypothetical protein
VGIGSLGCVGACGVRGEIDNEVWRIRYLKCKV